MNFLKALKKLPVDTSIFFTVITPIYAAVQMIINTSSEETLMPTSWLLYIFLFSLLCGISTCIYRVSSIHKALRVAIQYAIIAIASYICFFMPLDMTGSQVLVGLVFVSVIYFGCFGIGSFFAWRFRKNTEKEEEYEAKFKKKK